MATEMKQRRDTAASWTAKNEILGDGVIGVVRETKQFKIGDGTTPWNSLPFSVISPQVFDHIGDLLVGTGPDSFETLLTGTPGQRLMVQADGSLDWQDSDSVPLAAYAAKGDLVYASGAGTLAVLAPGATGQRLTVAADGSLQWVDSGAVPIAIVDQAGDLIVGSADNQVSRLAAGANGQVLTVTTGGVLQWITPSADVPLSTFVAAGDLVVGAGAGSVAKLAKGANGAVLTVVAGVLTWIQPSVDIPLSTIVAAGDLIYGSGAGAVARLAKGNTGQVLTQGASAPQWQDVDELGILGSAYSTSNIGTPTNGAETELLVTGNVNIINGKRYQVRVSASLLRSDNAAEQSKVSVRLDTAITGALIYQAWYLQWATSLIGAMQTYEFEFIGGAANNLAPVNGPVVVAAGNHTFHLSINKNSGSGNTATMIAAGTPIAPTAIVVKGPGA